MIRTRTLQRLAELEADEVHHLRRFAWRRLERLGGRGAAAEDVVQASLLSVLVGANNPGNGRTPRPADVTDAGRFLNYLRGVIASKAEVLTRHPRPDRVELKKALPVVSPAVPPDRVAAWNDFKAQFFLRLRQRAPTHLAPTIAAWEAVFLEADRIPAVNGNRKHAHQVRKLARRLLHRRRR